MLADAAGTIGDQQVRNRGTIGGSLAHADPSADYPAAMLALDAELQLAGPKGPRVVKAQDFFLDLFTVDLAADEMIVERALHPDPDRSLREAVPACVALRHRGRRGGPPGERRHDCVGTHRPDRRLRIRPRLTNVEQALAGSQASEQTLAAAARLAGDDLEHVNADVHASADYRRAMVAVFARRALVAALARA